MRTKTNHRVFSMILAVVMVFTMSFGMTTAAFADTAAYATQGTCGTNLCCYMTSPADITVEEDSDNYVVNKIGTEMDPSADITFNVAFGLANGMNPSKDFSAYAGETGSIATNGGIYMSKDGSGEKIALSDVTLTNNQENIWPDASYTGAANWSGFTSTIKIPANTLQSETTYYLIFDKALASPENKGTTKPLVKTIVFEFKTSKKSIKNATISDIQAQTFYGHAVTPEITVSCGDKILKQDEDYTLYFENNTAVGTAKAIVTGIEDYYESVEKTFEIVNEEAVQTAIDSIDAIGEITSENAEEKYEQVQAAADAYIGLSEEQKTRLPEGYADKLLAAQKVLAEALQKASIIDITHYVSTITPKMIYTGQAREAAIEVPGLTAGSDYTVEYSNNVKIGTASAVITGTGKYKGTITKTFSIVPAKAALSKVTRGTKKLTAYAKKQAGGVKYQFYAKRSGKAAKYYKTSEAKKVVKKLTKKKTYTVKVRAYKVVNGKTYYGAWSTAKKVKVK